ncbi:MAG: DUF4440 domain-containing protein [Hellea sp.]
MTPKHVILTLGLCAIVLMSGCAPQSTAPSYDSEAIKTQIRETLARQDTAWNEGDIDGFMKDYIKDESLRFASGGNIRRGWQATIDRYKLSYPDKAAMGTLSFTDLEINVITAQDALVFGRWKLDRAEDTPNGLFTLHMKEQGGQWLIVSDHTSSAAP